MSVTHKNSATAIALLRYSRTLPTLFPDLNDQDVAEAPCDNRTRLIVNAASVPATVGTQWLPKFTTALATKLIVSAVPATIRSCAGRLDASAPSATYYVQLWNLVDVPANGVTVTDVRNLMAPQKVIHVNGVDDQLNFDFAEGGVDGTVGLVFGLSTTEFTQTAGGAYLSLTAEYALDA